MRCVVMATRRKLQQLLDCWIRMFLFCVNEGAVLSALCCDGDEEKVAAVGSVIVGVLECGR